MNFISGQGPILTDSGGFQSVSAWAHAQDQGGGRVFPSSPVERRKVFHGAEGVVLQVDTWTWGSDIVIIFERVHAFPPREDNASGSNGSPSLRWAKRFQGGAMGKPSALLVIVQGGHA